MFFDFKYLGDDDDDDVVENDGDGWFDIRRPIRTLSPMNILCMGDDEEVVVGKVKVIIMRRTKRMVKRKIDHLGSSGSFELRLRNFLEMKMTIILNQQMMTLMRKRRRKTPGSSDWWPPPSTNGHKSSEMQRVMQIKPVGFLTDPSQPHFLWAAKNGTKLFLSRFFWTTLYRFQSCGRFLIFSWSVRGWSQCAAPTWGLELSHLLFRLWLGFPLP